MPAQPACFHRLAEILTLLWGFDTGYLDSQEPSDGDTVSTTRGWDKLLPELVKTGSV